MERHPPRTIIGLNRQKIDAKIIELIYTEAQLIQSYSTGGLISSLKKPAMKCLISSSITAVV
jgi:hypothetical protein